MGRGKNKTKMHHYKIKRDSKKIIKLKIKYSNKIHSTFAGKQLKRLWKCKKQERYGCISCKYPNIQIYVLFFF